MNPAPALRWRRRCVAGACSIVMIGVLAGCGGSGGSSVEGVRAGDVVITSEAIDARTQQFLTALDASGTTEAPAPGSEAYVELRNRAADTLLRHALMDRLIAECGVPCAVSEAEVNTEAARVLKENFDGDPAALDAALADSGITRDGWRERLRRSLGIDRLARERVREAGPASEADLRAFYEANPASYGILGGTALHAIVLPADEKALATRLAREATPDTFDALVREHSIEPSSRERGGYLGTIGKSPFAEELVSAAKSVAPGTVVPTPVQLASGQWVVLYPVTREESIPPFDTVRAEVRRDVREAAVQRALAEVSQVIDDSVAQAEYGPGITPPSESVPEDAAAPGGE